MSTDSPFSKASVVKNTAAMLGTFVVVATALRALVAGEVDTLATGLAALCALLLFLVYRQVRAGAPPEIGGITVIAIAFFIYATLSWLSDGLAGSVIYAAPLFPLLAGLMLGKRAARNVTVLLAALLLYILMQHMNGQLIADPDFSQDVRYSMRVLVLMLMLVAINWMVAFYDIIGQRAATTPVALDESVHDSLTGLLRREEVEAAAAREFDASRRADVRFSFAVLEIDDYQQLVDAYGLPGAENCLLGVADALRFCMRNASDDLGRYSETRLCVLMNDNGKGIGRVTDKLLKVMETLDIPVDQSRLVRLTVSIGICSEPARGLNGPGEIMAGAEKALARARDAGGNRSEREKLAAAS